MKASVQNHSAARYNLAGMYLHGVYVEKDEQMAVNLYRLSAEQSNSETRAVEMLSELNAPQSMTDEDRKRIKTLFEAFKNDDGFISLDALIF